MKERWLLTLIADPADKSTVPMTSRIRMFLKRALRMHKLKATWVDGTTDRWSIALQGPVGGEPTSMRVGQLLDESMTCYGLKCVGLRGIRPAGQPMQIK